MSLSSRTISQLSAQELDAASLRWKVRDDECAARVPRPIACIDCSSTGFECFLEAFSVSDMRVTVGVSGCERCALLGRQCSLRNRSIALPPVKKEANSAPKPGSGREADPSEIIASSDVPMSGTAPAVSNPEPEPIPDETPRPETNGKVNPDAVGLMPRLLELEAHDATIARTTSLLALASARQDEILVTPDIRCGPSLQGDIALLARRINLLEMQRQEAWHAFDVAEVVDWVEMIGAFAKLIEALHRDVERLVSAYNGLKLKPPPTPSILPPSKAVPFESSTDAVTPAENAYARSLLPLILSRGENRLARYGATALSTTLRLGEAERAFQIQHAFIKAQLADGIVPDDDVNNNMDVETDPAPASSSTAAIGQLAVINAYACGMVAFLDRDSDAAAKLADVARVAHKHGVHLPAGMYLPHLGPPSADE